MEKKRVAGRFVKDEVEGETGPAKRPAAVGAPRPRYCRVFARKRMAEAMPEVVEALIGKAKEGSVPHTKLLAELSGFTRGEVTPKVVKRRSGMLAGMSLEDLGDDE